MSVSPQLALALELKATLHARTRGLAAVRAAAADFAALPRYDTPEAFHLIARWTKARLAYAKKKRVVVGVSGGVDSSLTACVLKEAAPGGVTAFVLPCGSNPRDEADARALCRALRIPVERLDLEPAYRALKGLLSPTPGHATADGNLKTRLRTLALFHEAAARDALAVGAGDLDEGFVGYYTKGSGSDLAPIGSLHKREVRALLKYALGRVDAKLAARLSKKPADAGLVPGRTAEQDLGVTYGAIERALEVVFQTCAVYEGGLLPREVDEFARALSSSGVSVVEFRRVADLIYLARHKSTGAPTLWRADTTRLSGADFESE
ncbi:MAG: NAD(+) synthase [Myxococcales bacterium]|nr:NAD(+) synthase [Myxococcales bacterium]